MIKYSGVLPSMCTGTNRFLFSIGTENFIGLPSRKISISAFSPTNFLETKWENEIRSPARNGTVPSLATATPSKFCSTSPVFSPDFAEFEIGSNFRNKTPLSPSGTFFDLFKSAFSNF